MFPLKLNLPIIAIAVSFSFLTFAISNGVYGHNYENCSHLATCGDVSDIGYPFWGDELNRPSYCGLPDFKLECPESNGSDDHPVLNLGGDDYQLVYLKTNFSTKLKLLHHYPNIKNCIFLAINNSLSDDHQSISLFECHLPFPGDRPFSCDKNIYYHPYQLPASASKNKYPLCNYIQITLSSSDLVSLKGNMSPENMLERTFEMDFSREFEPCIKCEGSGGVCVSSDEFQFLCFCKDKNQTYSYACPSPKSGILRKRLLEIVLPVGSVFFLALLLVGLFYYKKQKLRSATVLSRTISYDDMRSDLEIGNSFFGISVFLYNELREATNNFDPDRVLGDGGFGIVYHGKLKDGREVAVKRLYERNYKRVGQFRNEVEILTKLKHPNLVTLYGCTSRHSRELLLVYEYIPNGTVADHLFGDRSESTSLTWTIRMKIALQTAEALSYLHASEIIHRDVKTNNILLDSDFSVKVADFGLSRLFPMDASHVSTAPQGTPGYLDPEYRKCYQVTSKSDVYSFGVVITELISSLPAIDIERNESEINLSTLAINKIQQGALDELVDRKLGFESNFKVKRMVTLVAELAFQCLQQEKEVRPSMEEVLEALKGFESLDYEALEAQEMSSGEAESGVEKPLRNAQNPRSSPMSVTIANHTS